MSKHKCNKELYRTFLQASSVRYSGLSLSEVSPLPLSHDGISRWLKDCNFRPREVWKIAKKHVDKNEPCILIADDTVLSKKRSKKIELVNYQYSGNEHDVIAGIGLVNLLWYGLENQESCPIDFRIYDKKTDGKTKNTHFCEMIKCAKARGLHPQVIVMDAWYSSLDNLKSIRDQGLTWVTTLCKNRVVNRKIKLETLNFPEEGLSVHLRGYGWVTVFKFVSKNGRIDYVTTNISNPTRDDVEKIMKIRWSIEVFHREVKQTCGIERCQARTGRAQRNHIFLAIAAWFAQHRIRMQEEMTLYAQNWNIIKEAIAEKIRFLIRQPIIQ
jgi:SRSO17 transposase